MDMTSTKKNRKYIKRNSETEEYLLKGCGRKASSSLQNTECSSVAHHPSPEQNIRGESYATDTQGILRPNKTMDISPSHH